MPKRIYVPVEGEIWIPMIPVAKGRPRLTLSGHVFTPMKTRIAEDLIRHHFRHYHRNFVPIECGLSMDVKFFFSNKKACLHTSRPDLDNLLKQVWDSLGPSRDPKTKKKLPGLLFDDDALIAVCTCEKHFHPKQGIWIHYKTIPDDEPFTHPLDEVAP